MDVDNNSWILGGDNLLVKEVGQQTTTASTTPATQSTTQTTTQTTTQLTTQTTTQAATQKTHDNRCSNGQVFNQCGRPCKDVCDQSYPCNFGGFELATGNADVVVKN